MMISKTGKSASKSERQETPKPPKYFSKREAKQWRLKYLRAELEKDLKTASQQPSKANKQPYTSNASKRRGAHMDDVAAKEKLNHPSTQTQGTPKKHKRKWGHLKAVSRHALGLPRFHRC